MTQTLVTQTVAFIEDPVTPQEGISAEPRAKKLSAADHLILLKLALEDAHRVPQFNTALEPWIGVSYLDGRYAEVSLRTLLVDSHLIADIADTHSLSRAAMRRFIGAMVAHAVRLSGLSEDQWRDLFRNNGGFPVRVVDALLDAHAESLWLYHPVKPFMQDLRLARHAVADEPRHISELVPELPGASAAGWFMQPGDRAFTTPMDRPAAARWLVTSWFYLLNGNCGLFDLPKTGSRTPHAGSAYSECNADVTNVWRIGSSLFRTMLRNIPDSPDVVSTDGGYVCAWQDPNQPQVSGDHIYRTSVTGSAALLLAATDGLVRQMIRGPIIAASVSVKERLAEARSADCHRPQISIQKKSAAPERKALRLRPENRMSALLKGCFSGSFAGADLDGVVDSSTLWLKGLSAKVSESEALELLLVTKVGSSMSPVWEQTVTTVLPARYLDASGRHISRVRAVATSSFDPNTGMLTKLKSAALVLFSPETFKSPTVSSAIDSVQQEWMIRAESAMREAFDDEGNSDAYIGRLGDEAHLAFQQTFQHYANALRYMSPYEKALLKLPIKLSMKGSTK